MQMNPTASSPRCFPKRRFPDLVLVGLIVAICWIQHVSAVQVQQYSDRLQARTTEVELNLTASGEIYYRFLSPPQGTKDDFFRIRVVNVSDNIFYSTFPTPAADKSNCTETNVNFQLNILPWALSCVGKLPLLQA